jgi:hypothetical protein
MKKFRNIDINLLKTRLGELLTGGHGDPLQNGQQHQNVGGGSALCVGKYSLEQNANSTTLSQSWEHKTGLGAGTSIPSVSYAEYQASKSSAKNATTLRQEEKMSKGKKYDEAKPMMALLSPAGLEDEAKAMTYGAKKYGPYNWRKGIAISRYLSAAMRHIVAVIKGELIDPESSLSHLGHAKANLGMAIQTLEDYPELNDLYVKDDK